VSVRPGRVILLKPCCLGDVLLSTPLAAAIVQGWPGCQLDWAVDRHSLPALAENPHVTHRLDASGCTRGDWRPGSLVRLTRAIRRGRYDVALVPERSRVMALLPWLAGVPVRIGLDSGGRGRLHSIRVPVPPLRHEAELYLDLARAAGLDPGPPQLVFHPSRADEQIARRVLAELLKMTAVESPYGTASAAGKALALGPLVAAHLGGGVNPGQSLPEKRWPPEHWAALLGRLAVERGARLVLLGSAADRPFVDAVRAGLAARALDLAGRLSLGEAGAVLAHADLYLGHDTGMSHLATAVGAPAVVIFGPTDPRRYGPLPGTGRAVAPTNGAVQDLADAHGSPAIRAVTVDAVWAACVAELAGGAGLPHTLQA
jgi:ADP-heptose:LPS heptosyltransferase